MKLQAISRTSRRGKGLLTKKSVLSKYQESVSIYLSTSPSVSISLSMSSSLPLSLLACFPLFTPLSVIGMLVLRPVQTYSRFWGLTQVSHHFPGPPITPCFRQAFVLGPPYGGTKQKAKYLSPPQALKLCPSLRRTTQQGLGRDGGSYNDERERFGE